MLVALVLLLLPLPAAAQPTDLPVIRIGTGPDDQGTPLLYGVKAGIYKKYGLDVQVVKLAGAAAVAAALAGGSLDLGKASTLGVVNAYGKGLPFTVIGNIAYYNAAHPDLALLVGAASGITTPKDLEGKTFGAVSLSDMNTIATFAWMDAHGVDRTSVKFVEMPASASLAAIEQGRIAATTVYEPYFTAFTAGGKAKALAYPFDALGKRYSIAVLFGNVTWVNAHRDLVDAFLRATQEASAYIATHGDDASALIAEFGGLDPSTIGNLHHPERGVAIGPGDIQPVIDAAAKYGVIPKAFNAADMICTCAMRK